MFLPLPSDPPLAVLVTAPISGASATAVSYNGRTVVGISTRGAFAWNAPLLEPGSAAKSVTSGTWEWIDATGAAMAVSEDGSVVAGQSNIVSTARVGNRAWVGTIPSVPSSLDGDHPLGAVMGISGDGTLVVGSTLMAHPESAGPQGAGEAVRWRWSGGLASRPQRLGVGYGSAATAISRDGRTIVGVSAPGNGRGFWWTEALGAESIGDLPGGGQDTFPRAVSGDGSVIVGRALGKSTEAFRWTEDGGLVGLGHLPGTTRQSEALGVSDNGALVVGFSWGARVGESGPGSRAFLWDATHGMRDLHSLLLAQGKVGEGLPPRFERWRLESAVGVQIVGNHARIFGNAHDANGTLSPFVAVLAEEVTP